MGTSATKKATKQVDKAHYRFESYVSIERWSSYYYQLREALALRPSSILEIGVGDGVLGGYVRANTAVRYVSADIDPELHPDVVADVLHLPFRDGEFDVVCAFEVLEHLPFQSFGAALAELGRVASKAVIVSLPHRAPAIRFELKLPFLPRLRVSCKIPFPTRHAFDGEHYFEIGRQGYSIGRIRAVMSERFDIRKDFVPYENQFHHFFVLDTRL